MNLLVFIISFQLLNFSFLNSSYSKTEALIDLRFIYFPNFSNNELEKLIKLIDLS